MSDEPKRPRLQFRLETALLIATFLCIVFAQSAIQRVADAKWEERRQKIDSGERAAVDVHWDRTSRLIAGFNFVAAIASYIVYRRKGRIGLWWFAGLTTLGTVLAILIDGLLRQYFD